MSKNNSRRRLDFSECDNNDAIINPYEKRNSLANTADVTTVTPETGIGKHSSRNKYDSKPHAARQLVTPQKDKESNPALYYQSDNEDESIFKPKYIHFNVGYHPRGELALDARSLKVYRFIRDHYLIPSTFEVDYTYGPLSGSSFEERVLRSYSLGQLEVRGGLHECDLQVCTYCGEEGHMKGHCNKLL